MSTTTPALQRLTTAFDELLAETAASALPDEQQPSALVLTFRPDHDPNARCLICGDVYALVRVLLMAVQDEGNEAFRAAFLEGLDDL